MRQDGSYCDSGAVTALRGRPEGDFLEVLKSAPLGELNARVSSLTSQERIILDLIVRGHCNKEICRALGIEITTTKAHASRIFKKLGVKNRVQAAVLQLWAILLSGHMSAPDGRALRSRADQMPARPSFENDRSRVMQCETQ